MSLQTVSRNPMLCDICQKKPKFGSYNFCGKNCASQAASLCDHCHLKPKRSGYAFCSKNCGTQAKGQSYGPGFQANGAKSRGSGGKRNQNSTGGLQLPQASQILNAVGQVLPLIPQQGKAGQIASAAAQLLPHLQAMVQQPGMGGPQLAVMQPQPMLTSLPSSAATVQLQPAVPLGNTTNLRAMPGSFQASGQPASPIANTAAFGTPLSTCHIPGCQQPVHVAPNDGQASVYCSMLHRVEAVQQGLADACIMCLKMPQSTEDHFCGKACRDEALSKPF